MQDRGRGRLPRFRGFDTHVIGAILLINGGYTAEIRLTLTRHALDGIMLRRITFPDAVRSGQIKVAGQAEMVDELFSLFDTFNPNFEIVEPKKPSN